MKKIVLFIVIAVSLAAAGYFGYQLYEAAIQNAEQRLRASAAKGIGEGIGRGLGKGISQGLGDFHN